MNSQMQKKVTLQCTVHFIQCIVYSVLIVHSVLFTVYCVQCTVYSVLCTVYCAQCTVYSVLCTVYCVQCTVYSVQCTLYSVPTVYCELCTLYSMLIRPAPHSPQSSRQSSRWGRAPCYTPPSPPASGPAHTHPPPGPKNAYTIICQQVLV